MATKIFVTLDHPPATDEKVESTKKRIADALGICPEDVLIVNGVTGLSAVDVPDELGKAREKADKAAAAEAEKAAKEQEAAAKAAAAPAAPVEYETWTVAELHAEANKRELEGRSGLDKAGLVKALTKADKKA